jgi:hypothetical protein
MTTANRRLIPQKSNQVDAGMLRDDLAVLLRLAVHQAKLSETERLGLRFILEDVPYAQLARERRLGRGHLWAAVHNPGHGALAKLRRAFAQLGFREFEELRRRFLVEE